MEHFDSGLRESEEVELYGLQIKTVSVDVLVIHQPYYIERIQLLPDDGKFDEFRSSRAALACITHTSSDIACHANKSV